MKWILGSSLAVFLLACSSPSSNVRSSPGGYDGGTAGASTGGVAAGGASTGGASTGGSAAEPSTGGSAGEAAAGGAPPAGGSSGAGGAEPPCPARCNDAGTALEVCDATGSRVTQPCVNEDPTNCSVACNDASGTAQCVHTAIDDDDDGYASAACTPAPGDDCDDTTQVISPGSTESCDGRDNDCDGYPDVLDASIDLAGTAVRVRRQNAVNIDGLQRIDVTWHTDRFFLVADDGGSSSIYSGYALIDGTSNSTALYDGVTLQADSMNVYDAPRVASLNGTLGMVVRSDGYAGPAGIFAIVNDDGSVATSTGGIGNDAGDVTHDGASFVLAGHDNPTGGDPEYGFNFALGTTSGTAFDNLTRDNLTITVDYQNVAHAGDTTAVVFTDGAEAEPSVQLMRILQGSLLGPTELAQPAQMGDIVALASGNFAMAWATPAGFKLQVRQTNGQTIVCDAPETTFGNGTLDDLDSVAVAESSLGIMVFAADSGGTTGEGAVFVFDRDCNLITEEGKQVFNRAVATHDLQQPFLPRIAVGGGYVALAWSVRYSNDPNDRRSYVRVLPEAMCE